MLKNEMHCKEVHKVWVAHQQIKQYIGIILIPQTKIILYTRNPQSSTRSRDLVPKALYLRTTHILRY
jgi:hypothetical protein